MAYNPFQDPESEQEPVMPFLVTSPYSPLPQFGDKEQIAGPAINIDLLNQQLASQPVNSSAIPSIIINTTVQNGVVQLQNGTVTSPSLNFYSDTTSHFNGIFKIGTDHWALVCASTNVFDITATEITHSIPVVPSATGNTLGDSTHRWDIFARNIDVSVSCNPTATGAALGASGQRWDSFIRALDVSTSINLGSLTASRLVASDGSKNLVSTDASSFIIGTANQITVTPSSGTVTLSTPQNLNTGASVTFASVHATSSFQADTAIGFFGTSPVSQTAAYTLNYSTTTRTLNAYTSNGQGSAYTGIDNAQAGTPYAKVADLNTLRVAYENLRASYDNLISFVRQQHGDLATYGLFQ